MPQVALYKASYLHLQQVFRCELEPKFAERLRVPVQTRQNGNTQAVKYNCCTSIHRDSDNLFGLFATLDDQIHGTWRLKHWKWDESWVSWQIKCQVWSLCLYLRRYSSTRITRMIHAPHHLICHLPLGCAVLAVLSLGHAGDVCCTFARHLPRLRAKWFLLADDVDRIGNLERTNACHLVIYTSVLLLYQASNTSMLHAAGPDAQLRYCCSPTHLFEPRVGQWLFAGCLSVVLVSRMYKTFNFDWWECAPLQHLARDYISYRTTNNRVICQIWYTSTSSQS